MSFVKSDEKFWVNGANRKENGKNIRKSHKFPEFLIDNQCIRDIMLYKG